MKKMITITKVKSGNRNNPWRVTFYLPNGKRSTRHFKKPQDAEILAAELGMEAVGSGFAVSLDERAALARLRRQAERAGRSSSTVLLTLNNESIKLANSAIPLSQLSDEYLLDMRLQGLRPKTLEHYRRMISFFLIGQENRSITDFSQKSVMAWVRNKYGNTASQQACKTPLLGMFRWANVYREEWGIGDEWQIPIKRKQSTSEQRRLPIVFTPDELDSLIRIVRPELQPTFALQAFAGIRPNELCSDHKKNCLRWESIDFANREIQIPWYVSKTNSEAIIRGLHNNIWAWLETVPVELRTGPICKCSYRTFRKWRKAALLEATGLDVWPKDVLRHSFATYNFFDRGLEHTLSCMRHSSRSSMLWRHYLGDGSEHLAKQYFSIYPEETEEDSALAS